MSTRAVQITELLNGLLHPTTGAVLDNHTAYFYSAGTASTKAVWTEKEKTNPFTKKDLGSIGQIQLYAEGNYKIVIREYSAADDGTIIYTWDNLRFEFPNYYVHSISATHTQLIEDDFLLVNTTSGAVTINLLAASSWTHTLKVRRVAGANNIILDPSGSETIDSAATLTITSDAVVEVYSDGSNIQTVGFKSSFTDSDNDTKIQVEESADEDKIRFDVGGTEVGLLSGTYTEGYFKVNAHQDADGDTKVQVEESSDEDKVRIDTGGAERVVIDSTGLTVTGAIAATTTITSTGDMACNGGDLSTTRTSDDAGSAFISGVKVSTTPADDDGLVTLKALGNDSGANQTEFAKVEFFSSDVTDTDEAGEVTISVLMDGTYRSLANFNGYNGSVNQGEIVFNESGQDVDFRVESSASTTTMNIDGNTGRVTFDIGLFSDGTNTIDFPTNGMAASKFMLGDSNTIAWFYLNTAPPGWKAISTGADTVIGIAGGSVAYNVSGGSAGGTWTQPDHLHTGPSHQHEIPLWGEAGNIRYADSALFGTGTTVTTMIANTASLGGESRNCQLTSATGTGNTGNSATAATWRPSASVGKLFQLDTA